jgi:DNA-binding IclR family transcriptional regulator
MPSREPPAGPERTLLVLERIARSEPPPTQAELAAELGIAKSTLSLLLGALRELGLIDLVDRRYVPGPRLLALGHRLAPRARSDHELRDRLRPTLEALVAQTGETVTLAVEVGGDAQHAGVLLAIDHVEAPHPLRFVPGIGDPLPLELTAAGRVLLAFSGRSAASLRPTARIDPQAFDAELALARSRGFAINEAIAGVLTIAAPLLGGDGAPQAAISVFGPTQRLGDPEQTIWPHLRDAIGAHAI